MDFLVGSPSSAHSSSFFALVMSSDKGEGQPLQILPEQPEPLESQRSSWGQPLLHFSSSRSLTMAEDRISSRSSRSISSSSSGTTTATRSSPTLSSPSCDPMDFKPVEASPSRPIRRSTLTALLLDADRLPSAAGEGRASPNLGEGDRKDGGADRGQNLSIQPTDMHIGGDGDGGEQKDLFDDNDVIDDHFLRDLSDDEDTEYDDAVDIDEQPRWPPFPSTFKRTLPIPIASPSPSAQSPRSVSYHFSGRAEAHEDNPDVVDVDIKMTRWRLRAYSESVPGSRHNNW